ncbi:MAG TPA: flagellar biosynthesis anti-sigma factor FlgM [Terriglobales bacterium]|jgi:flagellar biosynthesis anti-sigma factor FlgM|nr:flagellar biosynthesis anti-sigma factor FlgM [Terriglobales bacterium]
MRIGPNIPDLQGITGSPSAKTSSAANQENAVSGQASEAFPFPEDMVSLGSLKTKALQTPEVREEKIVRLQQSVAAGQYRLDPAAIAAAMQDAEAV